MGLPKRREEDTVADVVAQELMRTYTDRIMVPKDKKVAFNRLIECIKSEFLCGVYLDSSYLDSMVLGNYHDKP